MAFNEGQREAVITGGEGALGKAVAKALEHPLWKIVALGRKDLDVRDPEQVHRILSQREVDLLVCAAGVIRDGLLARTSDQDWEEVMNVNYLGAKYCAEAVIDRMARVGNGHIVFVSSHSAFHPPVGQVAYASAKAMLIGLVRDLAMRHGNAGIRVNAVLPGFLETPMTESVSPNRRAAIGSDHALGCFNTCEAVGGFIRFLHHELPYTSGQVFQLDSRLDPTYDAGPINHENHEQSLFQRGSHS